MNLSSDRQEQLALPIMLQQALAQPRHRQLVEAATSPERIDRLRSHPLRLRSSVLPLGETAWGRSFRRSAAEQSRLATARRYHWG